MTDTEQPPPPKTLDELFERGRKFVDMIRAEHDGILVNGMIVIPVFVDGSQAIAAFGTLEIKDFIGASLHTIPNFGKAMIEAAQKDPAVGQGKTTILRDNGHGKLEVVKTN